MDILWIVVSGLGGVLVGALLQAAIGRPVLRRARREEQRVRRELELTRDRLEEVSDVCRRALDLVGRGIEESARGANRAISGRTDARQGVARAIEEVEQLLDAPHDLEGFARTVHQNVEEQAARMSSLVADADAATRAAETAAGVALAVADAVAGLARGGELLGAAGDDTQTASAQLDDSLRRGQAGVAETVAITSRVATEAERGYRAVHKTLDEIERIRSLSQTARERIDALGGRVLGIGDVVRVIQEIAEKTNLLALNASIIAAQAGEHGRSFAVVAQEIKALAQKTASSTKQISEQIRGVTEESERAALAMQTGVDAVGEGFQVALTAGDAIGEIRQSSKLAQKKVGQLLRTMDEQASSSQRVVDAAAALQERAASLTQAIREQGLQRDRVGEAAGAAVDAASRTARVARESLENGAMLGESTERLAGEVGAAGRARRDLRSRVDRINQGAAQLRGLDEEVGRRLQAMNEAAARLREELSRLAAS
jgi:methyl-accepting chemotaxis protein